MISSQLEVIMEIETLGSLGEFVGSIAVLVTLVYLSVQTRQATKAAQQRSLSDVLSRRQELQLLLANKPELDEVIGKGCSRDRLTAIEAQRFTSYFLTYLTHAQDTYTQYKAGFIPKEIWEADVATITPAFTQPGFLDWWEHGQQFLTKEFAEVISGITPTALVLYDPETQSWNTNAGGFFGKDISQNMS
jgi:hypothetical protein